MADPVATSKPKVLVFGTGGVGCIYGWIVHKGGADVTVVCRTNYEAVKAKGITIRSAIFGHQHYSPTTVASTADAATHGPFDFIIVASKAFPGTAQLIGPAVTAKTCVVLAQNGIAVEDEYATAYPNNALLSGVVWLPATQVSPGVVEMGPLETFEIGTFPASAGNEAKSRAEQFSKLYKDAGATCPVYDDIQSKRWPKLALNFAFNPITALTRCDDGNFLRSSSIADDVIVDTMRQCGVVARAEGYDVTEEYIQNVMSRHRDRMQSGGKQPSMLVDVENSRAIEVEAILGNTMRIAQKHGLADKVPYIQLLYALAKGLNFSVVKGSEWKPILKVS
jgi:2-dehydropantoate 2-reductase